MFFLCFSLFSNTVNLTDRLSGNWQVTITRATSSLTDKEPEVLYLYQRSESKMELTTLENETIAEIPFTWINITYLQFTLDDIKFDFPFSMGFPFNDIISNYFIKVTHLTQTDIHALVIDQEQKQLFNLDFAKIDITQQQSSIFQSPLMLGVVFFIAMRILPRLFGAGGQRKQKPATKQEEHNEPSKLEEKAEKDEKENTEVSEKEESSVHEYKPEDEPKENEGKIE
ncbi:hypothetical protein TVAG_453280 [Trichomonas vaginalis G3]|uniref:Uncharacterized protein n=1 Tax=Trichomonas vaginalis (strain ATCC PRA-98 / G3) TaxID=412133 RepID=A2ES73_TRIV3|nr:hypothetical protein TVAGG3_0612120 [Trichomonas vaginalis G3]EAY04510.1 hypothetical protein TVAG_453280 [Trichomonas vaginalis G3]KAI5503264.1 hypothetical protein TVAGG3_0612120 [Trichomonas vaginalis G3]|eukprot:XP_001316733.1 hypothetical protein [Trichomonas vaginalis G3]